VKNRPSFIIGALVVGGDGNYYLVRPPILLKICFCSSVLLCYYRRYYLVDDDVKRNPYVIWTDDKIQDEKLCRKTAWQQDMYLNCNTFHEFDFQTLVLNQKSKHIGYVRL
jgi:hypothetical protein